jgi:Helix-hairpin-helix domain
MIRDRIGDVTLDNLQLAAILDEIATLLESQGANPYRVSAYRGGAETFRALTIPAVKILDAEGIEGLMRLPRIGTSLAHAIEQLLRSGSLPLLERLRGEDIPERLFATVPDIGPKLAHQIHESLGIETLLELEAAANDGRLASIPRMGPKRIRAVRESLAGRLRVDRRSSKQPTKLGVAADEKGISDSPSSISVAELLDIDAEYRKLANQGKLPRIAPRRFNPTGDAWLPVLHTQRGDRYYTAIYSNTLRAHELGAIRDWVVIYRDDEDDHGRWTVITAHYSLLRGRRIVVGRERECELHYLESHSS